MFGNMNRGGGDLITVCQDGPDWLHLESLSSYSDVKLFAQNGQHFCLNGAVFASWSSLLASGSAQRKEEEEIIILTELPKSQLATVVKFMLTGILPMNHQEMGEAFRHLGVQIDLSRVSMTKVSASLSQWRPPCHGHGRGREKVTPQNPDSRNQDMDDIDIKMELIVDDEAPKDSSEERAWESDSTATWVMSDAQTPISLILNRRTLMMMT